MKSLRKRLIQQPVISLGIMTLIIGLLLTSTNWLTSIWFVIFVVIAYEDGKHKSFPMGYGIVFLTYSLLMQWRSMVSLNGAIFLGLSFLMLLSAWLLKDHLGLGDVLVLMAILSWSSLSDMAGITFIASTLSLGLRLVVKGKIRKDKTEPAHTIAFIPFLFVGSFIVLLLFQ